jgi:hypothetical protein
LRSGSEVVIADVESVEGEGQIDLIGEFESVEYYLIGKGIVSECEVLDVDLAEIEKVDEFIGFLDIISVNIVFYGGVGYIQK